MGVKSEPKAMGRKRLKQLVFLTLFALSHSLPTEDAHKTNDDSGDVNEELFDKEINVEDLFHDLFITSRSARDLGVDEDDEEVADVTDKLNDEAAEDADMMTDEEVTDEAKIMEVARFNSYMDAIYRRMNAALRAKMMDPMEINLEEKEKKSGNDAGNKSPKSKKRVSRDVQEEEEHLWKEDLQDDDYEDNVDEDEMEVEIGHRMGKPKGKGKKGGKGKNKDAKKSGKNKDKAKSKKEEKEAERKAKKEKKAKKQEERLKKRAEKEKKGKKTKTRQSRSGDKKKKDKNKKVKKDNKKNKGNKGKNQKGKSKGKKNSKKGNRSRSNKQSREESEKMLGSLSGIATLRRDGDVMIENVDNHKELKSYFQVGPLKLEVSKAYGKGKARTIRSAKAVTDTMSGVMTLKVKEDGTAHVKKVVFKEPDNVDVQGSLSDNKVRSLRSMKKTVSQIRPIAAIRVLKTARYVLSAPKQI